jgi:hypothetical protein
MYKYTSELEQKNWTQDHKPETKPFEVHELAGKNNLFYWATIYGDWMQNPIFMVANGYKRNNLLICNGLLFKLCTQKPRGRNAFFTVVHCMYFFRFLIQVFTRGLGVVLFLFFSQTMAIIANCAPPSST